MCPSAVGFKVKKDEHVLGRAFRLVNGTDRGDTILALAVDDHQRVQEVAVL